MRQMYGTAAILALVACTGFLDPPKEPTTSEVFVANGMTRRYEWLAPSGASAKPVLLAFHGLGGDARQMRDMTRLDEAGTEAGFVVVFPEALPEFDRGWSVGCAGCTKGDNAGVSDVAYVDALLDHLASRTSIDKSRLYVTGFSMGGWFSYTLACARANSVKAIVTVGGLLPRAVAGACAPAAPVNVQVMFGDQDPTHQHNGSSGQYGILGIDSTAIFWANAASCTQSPAEQTETRGDVQVTIMSRTSCANNTKIARHKIAGLAHTWPRGKYDMTLEVMQFLKGVP